jgi:predicted DCC family thiol-disulfide oxidoreductase YuxK
VILFDGQCNLCHGTVEFVLRHDRRAVFRFAALGSPAARRILASRGPRADARSSVVLVAGDRVHTESTALLRILGGLAAPWSWLRVLGLVPRPLRDALYRCFARRRYRWFGRRTTCRATDSEWAGRFLDS